MLQQNQRPRIQLAVCATDTVIIPVVEGATETVVDEDPMEDVLGGTW